MSEQVTRFEAPPGYPWRRRGRSWEADGWDPEAEAVAAGLAGRPELGLRAAVAAMCGPGPIEVEAVTLWVAWVDRTRRTMPKVAPPPGLEQFVAGQATLLARAVNSKNCPVGLLRVGADSADKKVADAAVAHDNLPHDDRLAHLDPDRDRDALVLARAPTTPAGMLRSLATPRSPLPVELAALENPRLSEPEAIEILRGLRPSAVTFAAARPRLGPLILAVATDAEVAWTALASMPRHIRLPAATIARLLALQSARVDAQLAKRRLYHPHHPGLPVLVERAIAALVAREGRPLDPSEADTAEMSRVCAVLVSGGWPRDRLAVLIDHALSLAPEHGCPEVAGCWLCAVPWRSESVHRLPAETVARLLPHLRSETFSLRRHAVDSAEGDDGALLPLTATYPEVVPALVRRSPFDFERALRLGRRCYRAREEIMAAADPSIRPRLADEFRHKAERLPLPAAGRVLTAGRYRYEPGLPGWVVAASGRPARRAAVLGRLTRPSREAAAALLVAHDGLRLATYLWGLKPAAEVERRLIDDVGLFEEALAAQAQLCHPQASMRHLGLDGSWTDLRALLHQTAYDIRHRAKEAGAVRAMGRAVESTPFDEIRELMEEIYAEAEHRLHDLVGSRGDVKVGLDNHAGTA